MSRGHVVVSGRAGVRMQSCGCREAELRARRGSAVCSSSAEESGCAASLGPSQVSHLLQQGRGSLLAEDAVQQVFLQLQHRQLLLSGGSSPSGPPGETRLP